MNAPPFPVGESPFRIRGVAWRGHLTHYETSVPGGVAAVRTATDDPALRAYLDQQFLDGSLYDLYALARLDRIAAALAGMDYEAFVSEGARHQAEYDLRGVYRILLRVVSPVRLMARVSRLANRYFDFAPSETRSTGPTSAEVVRDGFPVGLIPWYAAVAGGYLRVAVERTGARDVTVTTRTDGMPRQEHGVDVTTVRLEVSWR